MKIAYQEKRFSTEKRNLIDRCNAIVEEYKEQKLDLTLRQLYYQLVARDVIPNKQTEYKRLGELIGDARMAGLMDWEAIEDRTRNLMGLRHYGSPGEVIDEAQWRFTVDRWQDQLCRVEVWVEKQALEGVVAQICNRLDVPYFSCRGYTSISEMWGAGQRLCRWSDRKQRPVILHLGDLDPSGVDMSRDIQDRLEMFMTHHGHKKPAFKRLALNRDQVEQYSPPPNPAKTTDSRFTSFQREFGDESWELDALNPIILQDLIRDEVARLRDNDLYNARVEEERRGRIQLQSVAKHWPQVAKFAAKREGM